MSDAFSEVQEELRQQRLRSLWTRYGRYLIGAVIATILITALLSYQRYSQQQKRLHETEVYYSLINASPEDFNSAIADADIKNALKALAFLNQAGQALQAGKTEEATALYEKVIGLSLKADLPYQGFARVMLSRLDPDRTVDLLNGEAQNAASPWHYDALLALAAHTATHDKNYTQALAYLDQIDENAPAALSSQAQALSHIYTVQLSSSQ